MKKLFISLLLTSPFLCTINTANASPSCYQNSCDGKAVEDYSCPVSFYNSKNIYAYYGHQHTRYKIGVLTFYYSAYCESNWAKVRYVHSGFLNQDIWVTVENGSNYYSSHVYSNGVAITPMINGKVKVKATGNIDSAGAVTHRATLEY